MRTDPESLSWLSGWRLDTIMLLLVCSLGLLLIQPGVFSVDESHYLLATKAMATGQAFHIDNGYEELKDPALLFFYTALPDALDRLGSVSTVPPFHAVLATPLLWLAGLSGLIWLNLLAFAASLMAVRRLATRLQPSRAFVLASVLAFAFATFSLEYAFGIWPHALSQAVAAWALLALLSAPEARRPGLLLLVAGLLAGLGCGIRLQHVLELPLFLLAAAWLMKMGWRSLLVLIGWLPPLAIMALINLSRLDTAMPFTYGAKSTFAGSFGLLLHHAWLPALGVCALLGTLWFTRRPGRAWAWALLILGGLASLMILPAGRKLLMHWASFAGYHLLDSSLLGDIRRSMGAIPNELGQALYGGVLKKSLLEAAPWLLLAIGAVWPKSSASSIAARVMALAGLGSALLLPLIASAGGLCYNPRYFVDLLPALAPLALLAVWRLGTPLPAHVGLGALAGLSLALPIVLHPGRVDAPAGGLYPMLAPLALASIALLMVALGHLRRLPWPTLAPIALGAGLGFASLLHLGVDLPRSLSVRHVARRMVQVADPIVEGPAILAAAGARKDVFSPLKLDRDLWILRLDPAAANLPVSLRTPAPGRAAWVLANGLPPERVQAWLAGRRLHRVVEKGLIFVKLAESEP